MGLRVRSMLAVVAAATCLVLAACGATDEIAYDRDQIDAVLGDELAELGMVITRASIIDTVNGVYTPTPDGNHLAIYVEPMSADFDEYASSTVDLARLLLPSIFDRWPTINSFDICQEPPPGVDDREIPPSVTVLEVTRDGAERLDWSAIDLADLTALQGDRGVDDIYFEADETYLR